MTSSKYVYQAQGAYWFGHLKACCDSYMIGRPYKVIGCWQNTEGANRRPQVPRDAGRTVYCAILVLSAASACFESTPDSRPISHPVFLRCMLCLANSEHCSGIVLSMIARYDCCPSFYCSPQTPFLNNTYLHMFMRGRKTTLTTFCSLLPGVALHRMRISRMSPYKPAHTNERQFTLSNKNSSASFDCISYQINRCTAE